MSAALGFIVAMCVTVALTPWLIRIGPGLGLIDTPSTRKVHSHPIPRVGGIAMVVGMLIALLLYGDLRGTGLALLAGNALLFAVGVWDDRVTLTSKPKFAGQALAAVLAMSLGGIVVAHVNFNETTLLPLWLSLPLTFLFLVGSTNAVNLSDGLDGLAGGMTLLCLCALAVIAFAVGNTLVLVAAAITAGAVLGFLRFNSHPARVFMGDAGSQVLGFTTAVLAIELTQRSAAPLSAALPLLLLGVPITDTVIVMTLRMVRGRSPFVADRNHLHHRLLALGFRHVEAVVLIYTTQCLFFAAAWFLRFDQDVAIIATYLLIAAGFAGAITFMERSPWRVRARLPAVHSVTDSVPNPVTGGARELLRHVPRWALILIGTIVATYAVVVAGFGGIPQRDVAWLAVFAAVVLLVGLCWPRAESGISAWEKFALYVVATLAVSLDVARLGHRWIAHLELALFAALAVAVVLWVRLSYSKRFEVTPLDLLVLVAAVALPNLPGDYASLDGVGRMVLKLLILFYALETLSNASGARYRWLNGAAVAFVATLLVRMT